ncbi:DMT family transporter [Marinomonas dokdonensis]|uniref:DMT family transporter n=1 Tax=Marinomonas dokdonensis TaxID=328224 RepID=UPI00405599E6
MAILCVLLVVIWSTGFIVGKLIVGLMDPNIFLSIRFFFAGLLFLAFAYWQGRAFPKWADIPKHMLAGVLMNSVYLGLSYLAISKGLPAGVMALIGTLQPVLVAILAWSLVKEKTSLMGLLGMLIGISGLILVISPALHFELGELGINPVTLVLACVAILALSFGVTYQKMSIASADLISAMAIQNLAAWLVSMGFVWFLGERQFEVQLATFLLIIWGVVVLSGAGLFLMVWLVRRVTASKVSVLLLLAPPLAAIESYFIFNEILTSLQIAGFVVTIFGVYISQVKGKA